MTRELPFIIKGIDEELTMSNSNSPAHPGQRRPLLPNAVLGVVVFILTEAMFFAGMISAFVIARAGTPAGLWPPPDQPLLPIEATAVNTMVLLVSGVLLVIANRQFGAKSKSVRKTMLAAVVLGALFLVGQGVEWVQLIGEGMTLQSSNHGAFFYFIVGAHGLHVLAAVTVLAGLYFRLLSGQLTQDVLWAGSLFWYFVVGVWPIIYWQVYL